MKDRVEKIPIEEVDGFYHDEPRDMNDRFEINGIAYRLTSRNHRTIYNTVHEGCRKRLKKEIVGVEVVPKQNKYTGEVIIPSHITWGQIKYPVISIGESAFEGCSELTDIIIPIDVLSIGECAFRGCSSLKKIFIPASVEGMGSMMNPFMGCSNLESIEVAEDSKNFQAIDGVLYGKVKAELELMTIPAALKSKKIVIPAIVQGSKIGAFSDINAETLEVYGNCLLHYDDDIIGKSKSLKHVVIGAGVTHIGDTCFYECTALETVTFCNRDNNGPGKTGRYYTNDEGKMVPDDSDLKLDYCAFHVCTSLKEISIPANTVIENFVFAGCDTLSTVTIGKDARLNGKGIFNGCKSLKIIIYAPVKSLSSDAFEGCDCLEQVIIRDCPDKNFDETPIRKHSPNVEFIYE